MKQSFPKRRLGATDLNVGEVGFGAWPLGADWGPEIDENRGIDALIAAFDFGVNFVDTADIYGQGRSERLVGEALRRTPAEVHVATKMGQGRRWDGSYAAVEKAAVGSMERLGADVIDLMQLHCIDPTRLRERTVFDHMDKLRQKGIIRYYGASVESIDEALFCVRHTACSTLQVIFNLFRQRVVEHLLPAAQWNRVGIICRVPLASGVLSGKFSCNHKFGENDHRCYNANGQSFNVGETFAGVPFVKGVEMADAIAEILKGESPDATLAQKSMRWILDHPEISVVIPGAKTATQALENAGAALLPPLKRETHEELKGYYMAEIDSQVRGVY